MFGGISFSDALGWWQTESSKVPATFTEGEFAGQAKPADIRGSYTFNDIANSFHVPPEILAQAFQVTTEYPSSFAVKDLESLYLASTVEIGTSSVRLFVAYYMNLPFDTTGQDIFLPRPAAELLLETERLTDPQLAYIQTHTVDVTPTSSMDVEPAPEAGVESAPGPTGSSEEYVVKGKTIFGELAGWGVPQAVIEQIFGGPIPDPAMKVKDYATEKGLDFETLKTRLQVEVDKVKK
jgi:hypothetical protein